MTHSGCGGPDACFSCKMRYWRENGTPRFSTPEGWTTRPSVFQRERDMIREAAEEGVQLERA